jgi:peptidoglycan hydrolase CwlO-like protein
MKLIAGIALGAVAVSATHPIQNVIDEMVKLRIQAKEEGEAETLTYNKFSHWCGKEQESLTGKIAKNNEKISGFESAIAGHKASIASLEDEIATLKAEIRSATPTRPRPTSCARRRRTSTSRRSPTWKTP